MLKVDQYAAIRRPHRVWSTLRFLPLRCFSYQPIADQPGQVSDEPYGGRICRARFMRLMF